MGPAAVSLCISTPSPGRVVHELASAHARVKRPSGVLLFLSGAVAARLDEVAETVARAGLGVPVLLVPASGVLSEQGELEQQAAASGLVWSGGSACAVSVPAPAGQEEGAQTRSAIEEHLPGPHSALLLFARADQVSTDSFASFARGFGEGPVVGAGSSGDSDLCAIDADGTVSFAPAAAVALAGLGRAHVQVSHAGQLITRFAPITSAEGGLVFQLGHHRALDFLQAADAPGTDEALLLAAITDDPDPHDPPVVLRPIRGVDPRRGALLVGPDATVGRRLAFAARHPGAARDRLEQSTRRLARTVAGAAPRFGFYLNCAGRGAGLYGTPDVDVRVLRSALGRVPLAGMHSAFEIAPVAETPVLHMFTGVLALFTSPS